jgi:hypothetical protein
MMMGKVSRNQRAARIADELEGRDPYRAGVPAIPRGKRQFATTGLATDHPGSKRRHVPAGWRPLALFTDESGQLRHFWPDRKRRGRQVAAKARDQRLENYGTGPVRQLRPLSKAEKLAGAKPEYTTLTGPQRRRASHKLSHALAKARES